MPTRHSSGLVELGDFPASVEFPTDEQFRADFDAAQAAARRVFELVCDADDWKAPIDAWVDVDAVGAIARAVEFFTATAIEVAEQAGGRARVTSIGYRMGPAGP